MAKVLRAQNIFGATLNFAMMSCVGELANTFSLSIVLSHTALQKTSIDYLLS